jgi:hypothetical protein
MEEIWKEIPNTNGNYSASNLGRIRGNDRVVTTTHKIPRKLLIKGKILKPGKSISRNGRTIYRSVVITIDLIAKGIGVHRLVAMTFIPNPDNKPEVNHIDGNASNNNVENLEWCTQSENQLHAYAILNRKKMNGEHNGMAKLTWEQVDYIRNKKKEGGRYWGRNEIAKQFNVTTGTIKDIVNNKIWKK